MHEKKIFWSGARADEAEKVLIMLHGRGGSAHDILSLAPYLNVKEYAVLAPQAANNTWYPRSFLAPPEENEPWLSSALELLREIVDDISGEGKDPSKIFLLGFSQGACLALEFAARNAKQYGGIVAFTGGLIGDKLYQEKYSGDFRRTPVFIGTNDPDPHVPVERVLASVEILKKMNADVYEKLYTGRQHTISEDEINMANKLVFGLSG